jgi:hypothetical protein
VESEARRRYCCIVRGAKRTDELMLADKLSKVLRGVGIESDTLAYNITAVRPNHEVEEDP